MTPAVRRHTPRGVTLIELVVALGVSAFTIFAATVLMMQQQRSYASTSSDRAQQEAGRMALRDISSHLRMAGYGVDPALAFDFGPTASVPRANLVSPATQVQQSTHQCGAPVTCRDSTAGSDEVVFLSRNPAFSRRATAVDTGSIRILGDLRRPLMAGQILLVSCTGGSRVRAYVTVAQTVSPPATPDPANEVVIVLDAGQMAGILPVFPHENGQLDDTCFDLTGVLAPMVTQVDRYRYYVDWFDPQGNGTAAQTEGARPYLMLDRGLPAVGAVPVAPDVEDLQLSYAYPPAVAGGAVTMVGASPGTNAAAEAFPMTTGVVPPAMADAPDAASRTTRHPANIRAVRISVVVRSSDHDLSLTGNTDRTLPAAGNRAAFEGLPGYHRSLFETTVVLRNASSQAFVYPTTDPTSVEAGVNVGGG
jgi:type IV pilus assembly protein PilW